MGVSSYTPEIAIEICQRLGEGESLTRICKSEHLPHVTTVLDWAKKDLNGFAQQYADARARGYEYHADIITDIADDGSNDWMERNDPENAGWQANGEHLQRSRLRVDTRKWLLSKMLPKVYGDKLTQELTGKDGAPLVPSLNVTIKRGSDE